ncbi:MAG: hypothetical protein GY756_08135 [bacterium]|nr:hypothetical protein [bacterium]
MKRNIELYMNYREELGEELWNTFFVNIQNINQNLIKSYYKKMYSVDSSIEMIKDEYDLRDVHDIL